MVAVLVFEIRIQQPVSVGCLIFNGIVLPTYRSCRDHQIYYTMLLPPLPPPLLPPLYCNEDPPFCVYALKCVQIFIRNWFFWYFRKRFTFSSLFIYSSSIKMCLLALMFFGGAIDRQQKQWKLKPHFEAVILQMLSNIVQRMHARNAFPFKCKWANHFVKHRFDEGTVHLHTCALTWKQKQIQTGATSAISNANHIISYKYIQQKVLFANIYF